jgi:hypothetical protein
MASNRIGTISNLETGGTYDILSVKVEGTYPEGKISFGFYDVPMKITGLQKVAQVFLKTLLTTKGSDVFYPNRGTEFPDMTVNSNAIYDDATLLEEIRSAVNDAANQTINALNVNTVDESSCLYSVEVLGLDRISEGIVLYMQLKTLAGEFAAVSLPFPEFGLN